MAEEWGLQMPNEERNWFSDVWDGLKDGVNTWLEYDFRKAELNRQNTVITPYVGEQSSDAWRAGSGSSWSNPSNDRTMMLVIGAAVVAGAVILLRD